MAIEPRLPASLEGIDAEVARIEERLAALAMARKKALEAEQDAGRPVLMAALARVRIAALSRRDAKSIARAIEQLGPAHLADIVSQIRSDKSIAN